MSHNKNLLLIGGPADGKRFVVSAGLRHFRVCAEGHPDNDIDPPSTYVEYAIHTLQTVDHGVVHVGVTDLSVCPVHALVAGYRKQRPHAADMNVALQLVTLIGGDSDGCNQVVPPHHDRCMPKPSGDAYWIKRLQCKDGVVIRVAVTDDTIDPLPLLIDGYRFGEPK